MNAWAIAAISILAASVLAAVVLYLRLIKPLRQLTTTAARMADGEFGRPIDRPPTEALAPLADALSRLDARVQEQVAALEYEHEHLNEILGSMSEGVLVTDRTGRALSTNPAFATLFELTDDATGKSALEICRQPTLADLIDRTLIDSQPHQAQLELGQPFRRILSLTGNLLPDRSGVVVVARDITDLVRFNQIRRDLVANVSHELKTPLTAIRAYAETLAEGALKEREVAVGFVERILHQCQRLEALLRDLLTLSRLESFQSAAPGETVDLGKLVKGAVELVSRPAADKEVEIVVELDAVPRIRGNTEALSSLIVNLLENAVKYNRPGGVVRVGLRLDGGVVALEVADTGIGIPRDMLPRVFERFFRVDKGRAREEGGTGLGLAIVKHAAQLHGGTVEVHSRLGKGSTFRVELPAPLAQSRAS